jgi:hypothetical protein
MLDWPIWYKLHLAAKDPLTYAAILTLAVGWAVQRYLRKRRTARTEQDGKRLLLAYNVVTLACLVVLAGLVARFWMLAESGELVERRGKIAEVSKVLEQRLKAQGPKSPAMPNGQVTVLANISVSSPAEMLDENVKQFKDAASGYMLSEADAKLLEHAEKTLEAYQLRYGCRTWVYTEPLGGTIYICPKAQFDSARESNQPVPWSVWGGGTYWLPGSYYYYSTWPDGRESKVKPIDLSGDIELAVEQPIRPPD